MIAPGSALYKNEAGLGYYIDAAGAFAYPADLGRTSMRDADGWRLTTYFYMPHRAHEQNPPNQYHVPGHERPELLLHDAPAQSCIPRWTSPHTGRATGSTQH